MPPKKMATSSHLSPGKRSGKTRTRYQRISSGVFSTSMNLPRFGRSNHTSAKPPHFSRCRSKRYMSSCQRTTLKTTKLRSASNIRLSSWSGMFRLFFRIYRRLRSFLLYRALKPPGWHKEWHIGVRVSSNRKLVAFISGVPICLRVRKK